MAREILADEAVAERHVFAAEERGRVEKKIRRAGRCDQAENAGRSFLVEIAGGIERQQALDEIGGNVGFEAVDADAAGKRRKLRDEAGARPDASREEFHIAEIRRHSRRDVGWIE